MKNRIIAFGLLILAVAALGIGFSAYSSTLTVTSSARVNPSSNNYKLVFANNNNINNLDYGYVTPINNSPLGGNGIINNGDRPTISGLTAYFDDKGESVSYRVYIVNTGKYTAYIKNFNFIEKNGSFNECIAREGTNSSGVEDVCSYIYVTVNIGNYTFTSNSANLSNSMNLSLDPNESQEVIITVTYDANAVNPNGDFYVKFGDLQVLSSTVPNS